MRRTQTGNYTHVNWDRLVALLATPRGGKGVPEYMQQWFTKWTTLAPTKDAYGNFHLRIGKGSTVCFTAHTDTVDYSRFGTVYKKKLITNGTHDWLALDDTMPGGMVLGADDGAGCEALVCLAEAGVPGYYFWAADEEIGCLGTEWALNNGTLPLKDLGITKVISFDRKSTTDIITSQLGDVCCSPEFARALGGKLGLTEAYGSFTDSAQVTHLVPECTNLSVGYQNAHTKRETLNVRFLDSLIGDCLWVNWESLPVARTPAPKADYSRYYSTYTTPSGVSLRQLLKLYPEKAVDILTSMYMYDEVYDELVKHHHDKLMEEQYEDYNWRYYGY